jgi:hypothetical protein
MSEGNISRGFGAGTEIVAETTDLTHQKFRETNPLDRSHVVDDPRTVPAMVRHLISAHGQFLDGCVYLRKWTKA